MLRIILGLILLVAVQAGVMWFRAGREPPGELIAPKVSLKEMPRRFGAWAGTDKPLDKRLFDAIKAAEVVDRVYETDIGDAVMVEVAVFNRLEVEPQHAPYVCYPRAGWTIKNSRDVLIHDPAKGANRQAQLYHFEQEGQRIHVLYWYQLGDATAHDIHSLRDARGHYFNKTEWPSLIKVMVQSSASDPMRAEDQLRAFAELLVGWTNTIQ